MVELYLVLSDRPELEVKITELEVIYLCYSRSFNFLCSEPYTCILFLQTKFDFPGYLL
jgi:hypothetical protein